MANVLSITSGEACPAAQAGPTLVPEYMDDERPEVTIGWRIGSDSEADWALQKMGELEAHVAAIDLQLAATIERETRRAEGRKGSAGRGVAFFEAVIKEYGEREKRRILGTGKRKSHAYLHGTIGWRKKGGKLTWTDEAVALEWAKGRPVEQGLFRVTFALEKAAIQKLAKEEKIIPPGTELEPTIDEVYVQTAGEE